MALRQRASNYALLTIDETPTPPRSGAMGLNSPAKYPTPLVGKWADYEQAWSPNRAMEAENAAGDVPSDDNSDDAHNISHEHSVSDEASPQTRYVSLPPQPVSYDPYHSYNAIQYPTTPYGPPPQAVPPQYSPEYAPPVYTNYPVNYQLCQCGCNQYIAVEYPAAEPSYVENVPWSGESSVASEPAPIAEPQSTFVPRFGPPPPPPVKMAQLLTEHGNPQGESVRYTAVLRWVERIEKDAPYFAPDVTKLPVISPAEPFDKTVAAVNEWWKSNFGDRQSHMATTRSSVSPSSRQPHQPLQPIRSANLSQYPMYDRSTISSRRHM